MPKYLGKTFSNQKFGMSSHEIINDNGARVVNFATSKKLTVKSIMFPHRNIYKFTWKSDGRFTIKLTIF
jgi:hypothetical protein